MHIKKTQEINARNNQGAKLNVATFSGLGLGGTEKSAVFFSCELHRRGHSVTYITSNDGPRKKQLEDEGVGLVLIENKSNWLVNYLRGNTFDVLFYSTPGTAGRSFLFDELLTLPKDERPALVELNVFGRFENAYSDLLNPFRCFFSTASLVQAYLRSRRRLDACAMRRQAVLFGPLEAFSPSSEGEQNKFREELEISEGDVLAIRVGRNDPIKWTNRECQAFQIAHAKVPNLRLLLIEPPPKLWEEVESGFYGPGIILKRQSSDMAWINKMYSTADLMIHTCRIGESFGYTVAEAMIAGLPLITQTTPYADNAQIELVENGVTGYVCASTGEMARRLIELGASKKKRISMGAAGVERINDLTNYQVMSDRLEDVLLHVCGQAPSEALQSHQQQVIEFARGFRARERNTSESWWKHPVDGVGATLYGLKRQVMADLRILLNFIKRLRVKQSSSK